MPIVSQSTRHFNVVGAAFTTAGLAAGTGTAPAATAATSGATTASAAVSGATGAAPTPIARVKTVIVAAATTGAAPAATAGAGVSDPFPSTYTATY